MKHLYRNILNICFRFSERNKQLFSTPAFLQEFLYEKIVYSVLMFFNILNDYKMLIEKV